MSLVQPASLMRLEGLLFLLVSGFVYVQLAAPWWLFVLLFFVPDGSVVVYRYHTRAGVFVYNLMHTYLTPILFLFVGLLQHYETLVAITVIWIAHISFDRVCGRGLRAY